MKEKIPCKVIKTVEVEIEAPTVQEALYQLQIADKDGVLWDDEDYIGTQYIANYTDEKENNHE